VIGRIREAVSYYGITAADLGLARRPRPARPRPPPSPAARPAAKKPSRPWWPTATRAGNSLGGPRQAPAVAARRAGRRPHARRLQGQARGLISRRRAARRTRRRGPRTRTPPRPAYRPPRWPACAAASRPVDRAGRGVALARARKLQHRPQQEAAEQQQVGQRVVGQQVGQRPHLHAQHHRVVQPGLDAVARHIGRGQQHEGHQRQQAARWRARPSASTAAPAPAAPGRSPR
jgi:hypothetical protein